MTKQRTNSATGAERAKSVDLVPAGPFRGSPDPAKWEKMGVAFQVVDRTTRHVMQRWIHGSHQHRQQPVGGWRAHDVTLPIMPTAGRPGSTWPADGAAGPALAVSSYRTRAVGKGTVVLIDQPVWASKGMYNFELRKLFSKYKKMVYESEWYNSLLN
jgi:hypothetical protein